MPMTDSRRVNVDLSGGNDRRTTSRSRRRSATTGLALAVAGLLAALAGVPTAGGALLAKVSNTSDTVTAAGYFSCKSAAQGTAGTAAYLAYPFSETGGPSAADITGNGRTGTYSASGVTYGVAGPCPRDGSRAITLNGSTGYVSEAASVTNPQIFSIEIWFKTTTGGGKLIGLGTFPSGSSLQYDRHLFLSNSGLLTFGVYPGAVKTITGASSYLDGQWHDAIATLAPSTDANPGMRLYVDGALVASDPSTTSAEVVIGYWRIGYDNLSGWGPNQPTNFYYTGSLAYASVYTYAMTPAQVAGHYRAGI
jgi:hypothetical protein